MRRSFYGGRKQNSGAQNLKYRRFAKIPARWILWLDFCSRTLTGSDRARLAPCAAMDIEEFIHGSARLLVITGAGCSTPSGIGDYRDDEGEWKRAQPVQHQEFMSSHSWRQRYWARSQLGYPEFIRVCPTGPMRCLRNGSAKAACTGLSRRTWIAYISAPATRR